MKQNPIEQFKEEVKRNVREQGKDAKLKASARKFAVEAALRRYLYNFTWLGRPIIQYPQDIVAVQELIWRVKPDLVVETGIAHGGSLILSASILELIGGKGRVVGVDIDIRAHNRREIEHHRMAKRIRLIEGSSVAPEVVAQVKHFAKGRKEIMAFLDSNHSEEHVLKELELYAPLVSKGSYVVVFDTLVEYMPKGSNKNRPWDRGNSPATAARKFLKTHKNFTVDEEIEHKLLITAAPGGFLKRVK